MNYNNSLLTIISTLFVLLIGCQPVEEVESIPVGDQSGVVRPITEPTPTATFAPPADVTPVLRPVIPTKTTSPYPVRDIEERYDARDKLHAQFNPYPVNVQDVLPPSMTRTTIVTSTNGDVATYRAGHSWINGKLTVDYADGTPSHHWAISNPGDFNTISMWIPHSDYIIFRGGSGGVANPRDYAAINIRTGEETHLSNTHFGGGHLHFDANPHDPSLLAIETRHAELGGEIIVIDLSNGQKFTSENNEQLKGTGLPRWSPDGKTLLFKKKEGVYLMNWGTKEIEHVDFGEDAMRGEKSVVYCSFWSVDGMSIYFTVHQDKSLYQLYIYSLQDQSVQFVKEVTLERHFYSGCTLTETDVEHFPPIDHFLAKSYPGRHPDPTPRAFSNHPALSEPVGRSIESWDGRTATQLGDKWVKIDNRDGSSSIHSTYYYSNCVVPPLTAWIPFTPYFYHYGKEDCRALQDFPSKSVYIWNADTGQVNIHSMLLEPEARDLNKAQIQLLLNTAHQTGIWSSSKVIVKGVANSFNTPNDIPEPRIGVYPDGSNGDVVFSGSVDGDWAHTVLFLLRSDGTINTITTHTDGIDWCPMFTDGGNVVMYSNINWDGETADIRYYDISLDLETTLRTVDRADAITCDYTQYATPSDR